MKRLFAPFFFFGLFFLSPFFTRAVLGQYMGVNIAGKHDKKYINWAAKTVGAGGAVTIMAKPGDADVVQQLFDACAAVKCGIVVVRADWAGSNPGATPNKSADAYTASLGSIDTHGIPAYVVPLNEPNMPRETGGLPPKQAALQTQTYVDTLHHRMDEGGVSKKFSLLSPMINRSHPNYREFLSYFRPGFFQQFAGIVTNSYLFSNSCGDDLSCGANPFLGVTNYSEDLRLMGVPNAKIFALETGEVFADPSCKNRGLETCPSFKPERMAKFLAAAIIEWSKNPNFVMATVLSYDPEAPGHPDWINSLVADFIKQSNLKNTHKLPPSQWSDEMKKKFESWLAEKIKKGAVKKCPDGSLGYGAPGQMDKMCKGEGIAGGPKGAKEISDYFGETKGTFSFTRLVFTWPNQNASDVNQEVLESTAKRIISANKYDVSDNSKVADNLAAVNNKLIPPEVENKSKEKESQGEVRLELCIKGTTDWYYPKETIKLDIPASYQKASTNGRQVAGFISPPGTGSLFFADVGGEGAGYFAKKDDYVGRNVLAEKSAKGAVLGKNNKAGEVLAQGPTNNSCPAVKFTTWGEGGNLCWAIDGVLRENGDDRGQDGCDWGYNILIDGNVVFNEAILGKKQNCLVKRKNRTRITCHMGTAAPIPFSGSHNVSFAVTQVGFSHELAGCKEKETATVNCQAQADGSLVCKDAQGMPIPTPTPPPPKKCAPVSDKGIEIGQKGADPAGRVPVFIKKITGAKPISRDITVQEPVYGPIVDQMGNTIQGVLSTITRTIQKVIGWKKTEVVVIVNFYSSVPFTLPDEGIQRLGVYGKTCLPGTCPDFAHGRSNNNKFTMKTAGSQGKGKTVDDINAYTYGQGGPDKMWDYNLDPLKGMLNPPDFGGL